MPRIQVVLNGTDFNPYSEYGLRQNPFPQIAEAGIAPQLLHLARLGGDPIPDTTFIRNHLKGWSEEFIEMCCKKFRKGFIVKFWVSWN